MWIFIVCIVVVFVFVVGKLLFVNEAKKAYLISLEELKQDPTNPDLKQKTLQVGRAYSQLTRDSKGHTLFDEVALMNDINAACARATVVEVVHQSNPNGISKELRKLTELLHEGILTADEWQRAKEQIVGKQPNQIDEAVKLLRQLSALTNKGVLTQSEYNLKKWDILSQRLIPRDKMPQPPPLQQKEK